MFLNPIWSKLNEFPGGRNPVRVSNYNDSQRPAVVYWVLGRLKCFDTRKKSLETPVECFWYFLDCVKIFLRV